MEAKFKRLAERANADGIIGWLLRLKQRGLRRGGCSQRCRHIVPGEQLGGLKSDFFHAIASGRGGWRVPAQMLQK